MDRPNGKVIGELKDVLFYLSSNPKVHQTINIIVLNILEEYGVILSRDYPTKLNGYFAIDWSHLWLPYKGQPNKIKVECECYMKHMVTNLNNANELVSFSNSILCNFYWTESGGVNQYMTIYILFNLCINNQSIIKYLYAEIYVET